MEGTIFKFTALRWARKWLSLLPLTYSCLKLRPTNPKQNCQKTYSLETFTLTIFSLWDASKTDIERFITLHPTIKFTAEISNTETTVWIQ